MLQEGWAMAMAIVGLDSFLPVQAREFIHLSICQRRRSELMAKMIPFRMVLVPLVTHQVVCLIACAVSRKFLHHLAWQGKHEMTKPTKVAARGGLLSVLRLRKMRRAQQTRNAEQDSELVRALSFTYFSASTAETTSGPKLAPVSLLYALWLPSHIGCFLLFQQRHTGIFFPTGRSYISFIGSSLSALSGAAHMRGGPVRGETAVGRGAPKRELAGAETKAIAF